MGNVNQTFNAVTSNMYKRADRRFHPLLELALMLNQLYGMTYFTDLTLLAHLVAISLNVDAKTLMEEPHADLRMRLIRLEDLRNIFFSQCFNWIVFVKPDRMKDNMITLERAITMLEDYVAGCQQLQEPPCKVMDERKEGYNIIHRLTKHKSHCSIIMQVNSCKGKLSHVP